MEKKKFYVNIGTGEISQIPYSNNDGYVIHATEDEVRMLRAKFENMHGASFRAFWRSHVPIKPYHEDEANDDYDDNMAEAFELLHEWGDEQTKSHIQSLGLLSDRPR
ncbi:hydrolase [Virgibacillus xinjiangensis]|uniref:Hydrolase n=1 Tax=Virgibacillus xinjiangensis TaxID=393090 RepID=A0ABV7CZM8_9BACI